jgi:hypothetical protein
MMIEIEADAYLSEEGSSAIAAEPKAVTSRRRVAKQAAGKKPVKTARTLVGKRP